MSLQKWLQADFLHELHDPVEGWVKTSHPRTKLPARWSCHRLKRPFCLFSIEGGGLNWKKIGTFNINLWNWDSIELYEIVLEERWYFSKLLEFCLHTEISLVFFNICHGTVKWGNHLEGSCPSVDREVATLMSEETMIRTNGYSLTCFAY